MMNNFSTLSAESAESHFAQLTTEEVFEANGFFDELNAKLDSEFPIVSEMGLAINRQNWELLNSIHGEISPIVEKRHQIESFLESI